MLAITMPSLFHLIYTPQFTTFRIGKWCETGETLDDILKRRDANVQKRAQELIGVGQSQAALSLLHEHVTSKRTRNNPIASIEPVMILFVELCVDLKKGKAAKDGLYSYKNTAQNTNIGTIEVR